MKATAEERAEQTRSNLNDAMVALWNVQGSLRALAQTEILETNKFPEEVASILRLISFQVEATVAKIEPTL